MTEWLKQQPDPSTEPETADNYELNLLEMIKLNHMMSGDTILSLYVKFSISQLSGCIGITSRQLRPTLSVMYPGTDKLPLILSRDDLYISALFVTISGQEYLAAASTKGIHLWNLANSTSSFVYKFKEQKDWNLCVIDERTIACVAEQSSSDGFGKVYILNTDSEKFSLSGMIQVKIPKRITDTCYVKTADGTPCLLLRFPWDQYVQCVEMVGGRVRWQVDTQQMGESFLPWSICTDGNTVFVVHPLLPVLHLLSVEDGSVLTSINLSPFDFRHPGCVRLRGDHLFVAYTNKEGTYCISKFNKPTAV